MTFEIESYQSSGLRNDKGRKFVPHEYFYDIENMNYDGITGCQRIKSPSVEYNVGSNRIDGIFQFRYVNSSGAFVTEAMCVQNGALIKNFLTSPTTVYTGLTPAKKCTFAILNDKLFVSNGTDFPIVYDGTYAKQMGAPTAKDLGTSGVLTGTYYYAMTYVVSGVELLLGTVSNSVTVSSETIDLDLPVGIATTTERKIYRTTANGSQLKLLTTISDNTTLTFSDNNADGTLGINIPATNSECPKPKFITSMGEKLVGCVVSKRPNYLYVSEFEVEVLFNTSGVSDVSGVGNDNSALSGMMQDYDTLVVFSEKHIYLADTTGLVTKVQQTTSNVGCLDGFTIVRVPENALMPGGIMFVSNLYDIRVFSGNVASSLSTSFDNLKTNNFSEQLNKSSLENQLKDNDLHAAFFDYKYHLIAETYMYVYDIRIQGWTKYLIKTTSYSPQYWVFGQFDNKLYVSQKTLGIVEHMYNDTQYRGEEITAYFETPEIAVGVNDKYFKSLYVYYDKSGSNSFNLISTINSTNTKNATVTYDGAFYADDNFDEDYYETTDDEEDYKVMHIDRYGKWLRFKLSTTNQVVFRGWRLEGRAITGKEV